MLRKSLMISAIAGVFALSSGTALAQGAAQTTQAQVQEQQRIFGSQLMTAEERNEYRAKMRAAKTLEEREQIRREHHDRMLARAREMGVSLPDEPPARGAGRGMSPGGNAGPGSEGMGPGRRNR